MSAPFGPFALTLGDIRKGKNKSCTIVDAGLSAFSVFFMQSPSFLETQRSLEQTQGKNNTQTLFGVHGGLLQILGLIWSQGRCSTVLAIQRLTCADSKPVQRASF